MTDIINRRKAMTAIAAAPAVAALPLAAFPAQAKDGYTPFAYPEYARHLWQQYIEAEKAWMEQAETHEQAESEATYDVAEVEMPWLPRGPYQKFESRDEGAIFTFTRINVDGVMPCVTTEDGNWLVLEYQPFSTRFPDKDYVDQCKTRWQPYTAESATEALELSRARGEREWRSFCDKVGQIHRKRRVRALAEEVEAAWDQVLEASHEIAEAPCDGPVMLATKLALGMVHECPTGGDPSDPEDLARLSAYRTAVACGGFDPIEQYRSTPGV